MEFLYDCPYCEQDKGSIMTIYPEAFGLLDNGGFYEELKCTNCGETAEVMFGQDNSLLCETERAIKIHGLNCVVCGFNFEKVYGERGKGFIVVYYVNPISTMKEEIEINLETDLVPVCSNCYRMIHRRKNEVLSVEELKDLLRQG